MLLNRLINWFGLVAGVLMLVVVSLSFFTPWWQLQVGSNLATVNADPFYSNFGVLGLKFVVPILLALNIGTMVLFVISGALLILYSIKPLKSYGKELLCYGYKRPIYTIIGFIIVLTLIAYVVPGIINAISGGQANLASPLFPLIGTSTIQLPTGIFSGSSSNSIQVGISVITSFQYTFYLAVAATILAIIARFYHRIIAVTAASKPPEASPATTPAPTTVSLQYIPLKTQCLNFKD